MTVANNTYGVDEDVIQEQWAQLVIESDDASAILSDARVAAIVAGAASRLNGVILAGGFDPTEITAAAYPIAYENCQRIVVALASPRILRAAHHLDAADEASGLYDDAVAELKALAKNVNLLGLQSSSVSPRAVTHVEALSLDTTDSARKSRRMWDTDDDTDKVYW